MHNINLRDEQFDLGSIIFSLGLICSGKKAKPVWHWARAYGKLLACILTILPLLIDPSFLTWEEKLKF